MGINKLEIKNYEGDNGIVLGGMPVLDSPDEWPYIPGTSIKQTLIFTIFSDYFKVPTLLSDICISVFISIDEDFSYVDDFAYHSKVDVKKNHEYATVLLHKRASNRLNDSSSNQKVLPIFSVRERPFSQLEFDADTKGITKGSQLSKNGGQPGWLQDSIFLGPQYFFELQFNEYDLRKASNHYDGLFNDGIGYLFLNHNTKKLTPTKSTGVFFVQYT